MTGPENASMSFEVTLTLAHLLALIIIVIGVQGTFIWYLCHERANHDRWIDGNLSRIVGVEGKQWSVERNIERLTDTLNTRTQQVQDLEGAVDVLNKRTKHMHVIDGES